jgi:predicted esterase
MSVYEGRYVPSPDFQEGKIPFVSYGDGGALAFDAAGDPVLQREFDLRFALAVPDEDRCPLPAEGYPLVLYAHGTGGNYRSMLGAKDEAEALAKRCMATMGIDQIFHGTRPGSDSKTSVELLFFNTENPVAARANGPQSAIDVVQQARLFTETQIRVPAAVSRSGKDVHFDPTRVAFFGHSQGGLNGPMFLAVDNQSRGGVLSGSGSMISITLLEKTEPVNVAALVKAVFLGLNAEDAAEVNELHPAIALAQTIVDPTDPIHYVRAVALEPRPGFSAKSVLMTEGVNEDFSGDNYTPPHAIEVQAVALGLPPQEPIIHPIAELAWTGLSPVVIPAGGLSGNLAGGNASGVLAQWEAARASDGHFVIYDIPEAMAQAAGFLRHLMDDPKGRVPAP